MDHEDEPSGSIKGGLVMRLLACPEGLWCGVAYLVDVTVLQDVLPFLLKFSFTGTLQLVSVLTYC